MYALYWLWCTLILIAGQRVSVGRRLILCSVCVGGVSVLPCSFFFFFQAEDGIRDLYVTGVQTCALPICGSRPTRMFLFPEPAAVRPSPGDWASAPTPARQCCRRRRRRSGSRTGTSSTRSEERRVGKECRSRWSPDH